MTEFRLPSLGADMEAATLVEWHVQPGATVKRGEVLVSVETDKGIIDVEGFDDGVLEKILVPVDTKVAVGTPLALIRVGNEVMPSPAPAAPVQTAAQKTTLQTSAAVATKAAVAEDSRQRVSPAARKRARELNVAVENVKGTGPHGAITIEDIERAAKSAPAAVPVAPAAGSAIVDPMRRAIAAAMEKSKREIPHYYLTHTIDMSVALDWLETQNKTRAVTERLVYGVLLVKAVALAVQKTPELNGWWQNRAFKAAPSFNVGMVLSLRQGGMVVPVLPQANEKNLSVLMQEFLDVVARARSGRLRSSDLAPGSITITSLGEQGVESVVPVIYPPQVAIVGFGAVLERPWVVKDGSVKGSVESRRVMQVTLAADHRASDGANGSRFLNTLDQLLQQPEKLL